MWQVTDPYYAVQYQLLEEEDTLRARVLYYNDGTQNYRASTGNARYLSRDLQWSDGCYVDGVSGATKSSGADARITIQQVHEDTLEVRYAANQSPAAERWVRVPNH